MAKVQLITPQRMAEIAACRSYAIEMLREAMAAGLRGDVNEYARLRSVRQMIASAKDVYSVCVKEQLAQGKLAVLDEKRKGAYLDRRTKEARLRIAEGRLQLERERQELQREAMALRKGSLKVQRSALKLRAQEFGVEIETNAAREAKREQQRAEIDAAVARVREAERRAARPGLAEDAGVLRAGDGSLPVHADAEGMATGGGGDSVSAAVPGGGGVADPGPPAAVDSGAGGVGTDAEGRGEDALADGAPG